MLHLSDPNFWITMVLLMDDKLKVKSEYVLTNGHCPLL